MPEDSRKMQSNNSSGRVPHLSGDGTVPEVPEGGARVRVFYAGAKYSNKPVRPPPRTAGFNKSEQPVFPGYEVSGVIDKICNKSGSSFKNGDRVIVFPEDDSSETTEGGFKEFIIVMDITNILNVPDTLPLQVAALLPCGALLAYTAVKRVKPFIEQKLGLANLESPVNLLIVGAGGLGLWTLKMAQYLIAGGTDNIHITVADVCIDKLMVCKDQGCYDVVHWNDSIHEEYILERTKGVCTGGVDIAIDYVSSPRTVNRLTKVLKEEGLMVVGGSSKYDINVCLKTLVQSNQCVMGVKRGNKQQLTELIDVVANGQVTAPPFQIFPLDQANKVFDQLQECRISARAVLEISPETHNQSPS